MSEKINLESFHNVSTNVTDRLVFAGSFLDSLLFKIQPLITVRWTFLGFVAFIYVVEFLEKGSHAALFFLWLLHSLKLVFDFVTPVIVPKRQTLNLPDLEDEEVKPYNRVLPEFDFWKLALFYTLLVIVLSFVPVLDIYFNTKLMFLYTCVLVVVSVYEQYKHMQEHNYTLFPAWNKKRYN